MLKPQITKIWDRFIEDTFHDKPNVREFLKSHERKEVAIDQLCKTVLEFDGLSAHKAGFLNRNNFDFVAKEMCKMFCLAAIEHKQEQLASQAEKQRRINEHELKTLFEKENSKFISEGQMKW